MEFGFVEHPFFSPFEDCKIYNGRKYKIIRKLDETEVDKECGEMFLIEFETGTQIDAFREELDGDYVNGKY